MPCVFSLNRPCTGCPRLVLVAVALAVFRYCQPLALDKAAACESLKSVCAVARIVVPGTITPDRTVFIPFLAISPESFQSFGASGFVELAAREYPSRRVDGFHFQDRTGYELRPELHFLHDSLGAALKPEAFAVA